MDGAHLVWAKGGHARLVSLADDQIVVSSTTPAPPGARLEANTTAEPVVGVKIKSHGSKREADGTFTIKGRLFDATRDLRARLAALVRVEIE